METNIFSIDELKNLFLQEFLNKVDGRVSKVSDHSVLNGVAYGFAKVFQKSMKDVALLESELFPDSAYGVYLDRIAKRYGISERKKYSGSSVYLKIVADAGSVYLSDNCRFISSDGISFELEDDFEVGDNGWGYVKVKSVGIGSNTNVKANSITKVTGQPSGHKYVTNELPAMGGVDVESDNDFVQRILQNFNNFSFETLDKLTSVFQIINPSVLLVRKLGKNNLGQVILGIASTNGVAFSDDELSELEDSCRAYLSLQDLISVSNLSGDISPVILKNMDLTCLDLDFRISLESNVSIDDFKVAVQRQIVDYLDFNDHKVEFIEWEDIFSIIRSQPGVKVLSESTFFSGDSDSWSELAPHRDLPVPSSTIPRLRMFVVRDLNGTILFDNNNAMVPYYYGSGYTNVFNEINNTI